MLANLASDHGDNKPELAEIQRIAQETADSMRDIVWLIQPGRGNSSDLSGRMREIALKQLAGSECVFEAEGVCGPFPLDFERQVMLLFKEALNNIRKHARARRIGIRLTQNGRDFSLLIADDGEGFDMATPRHGHGLVSMNHRAGLIGATLAVESSPSKGTHLALHARLARSATNPHIATLGAHLRQQLAQLRALLLLARVQLREGSGGRQVQRS